MLKLKLSVGRGGHNESADVRALTSRLKSLGFDWCNDGTVDDTLFAVIDLVQSIKAGRASVSGDGRVDVPGLTYDWLRAENAPGWQVMPEGTAQDGFVNIERADPNDQHDFGTTWMAETIRDAGARYRDTYLANHSGAALLTVNDVSLPRGGDTPDHSGHETGLNCDLRLPRQDGSAPGNTRFTDAAYDQHAMRAMLEAVRVQPLTHEILFNDPSLIAEGLCKRATGHDDHVHFSLKPLVPVVDYARPTSALVNDAILFFGGTPATPADFPLTQAGFQAYLDALGVTHFTASEMLVPHKPEVARRLGYGLLLPPHRWWPRGAALALLADRLRRAVGEAVTMRNWWRPEAYNAAVDGAATSDHITAHGVDLDYRSADSRRIAEQDLRALATGETWLELSAGFGNLTTHVGLLSPGKGRTWLYDSYVP